MAETTLTRGSRLPRAWVAPLLRPASGRRRGAFRLAALRLGSCDQAFQFLSCDATPQEPFELLETVLVVVGYEANRIADRLGAAGAANAVHVVFWLRREIVVDDV